MLREEFPEPLGIPKSNLSPTRYGLRTNYVERMTGFEPATSTLARLRSSQLSYIRSNASLYQAKRHAQPILESSSSPVGEDR